VLPEWDKYWTHCQIMGAPRLGKSFLNLLFLMVSILEEYAVAYLGGGKDDTYDTIVAYIARAHPRYKAEFINASDNEKVRGFNPFRLPKGRDLSAHVSALSQFPPEKGFGEQFPDEEMAEAFFAYLCTSNEPIWSAMRLLGDRKAWSTIELPEKYAYIARNIAQTEPKNWEYRVGALRRFLLPFATSTSIRRILSAPDPVDIGECYEKGIGFFLKASPSRYLSPKAANALLYFAFAGFHATGIENAGRNLKYRLHCDEIQLWAPPNLGDILDTILSSGLSCVLIHHHDKDFPDERMWESIKTSCRIKIIFGGLVARLRKELAEEAFVSELNSRWHKEPRYAFITDYEDELVFDETEAENENAGVVGEQESSHAGSSRSVRSHLRLKPTPRQVQVGQEDYTHEQVLSQLAERFVLPKQECWVLFPDGAYHGKVRTLRRYLYDSANCVEFRKALPGISPDEADRLIHQSERSRDAAPKRARKKPPSLFDGE
jgi:hypothetical protein